LSPFWVLKKNMGAVGSQIATRIDFGIKP
jgi:hypothetical protein